MPSVFVKLRTPPDASARWRAAASSHGLTLSAWLRGVADAAAAGRTDLRAAVAEFTRIRREINAVGNNLNQLVRAANAAAQAGRMVDAHALRDAIEAARAAVDAAAGTIRDAMRGGGAP